MSDSPINEVISLQLPPVIHLEDLPDDILNKIFHYLCFDEPLVDSKDNVKVLLNNPPYSYIQNKPKAYDDLLSLSSTCTFLRKKLGPRLFHSLSLIRSNQVDAILATPKSQELFSDKKTIQRHFLKELIGSNIESCGKAELARLSFRTHINGDKSFKSRYQQSLMISRFISYLECDNTLLRGDGLQLFPRLTALRVLDMGSNEQFSGDYNLSKLTFLAINAKTLINTPQLLSAIPYLKRLDLFLDYGNLPYEVGIAPIINQFRIATRLTELVLFLNNSYTIGYTGTIELLQAVDNNSKEFKKLTIRSKRRKSESTVDQSHWQLYNGCVGEILLPIFQSLTELILDIPILDSMKFESETYCLPTTMDNSQNLRTKTITLVDQAVVGPTISSNSRENIGVVIRHCQFTNLSFQYGESIEESHIHVLKLLTDFVQWLGNGRMDKDQNYTGIRHISLEKCWSMTDDSLVREYISDLIAAKNSEILKNIYPWMSSLYNSPRYKDTDSYNVTYVKETGVAIMDSRGYFIGLSDSEIDKAVFTTVDKKSGVRCVNLSFWSGESSLIDFEQYSNQQRKSLLWG
ncbi:hypothetical protein SBY92_000450 [Candida maltosa Xu316]|uniref:Uncharacterized protein n=1 Tax=Candida maltosa (strain Xu316) TaxID=1245528 RepID=M3IRJ2_CANMX|nr:hypothetical protein G210_0180 [Candida maltosa Xu316]